METPDTQLLTHAREQPAPPVADHEQHAVPPVAPSANLGSINEEHTPIHQVAPGVYQLVKVVQENQDLSFVRAHFDARYSDDKAILSMGPLHAALHRMLPRWHRK